MEDSVVILLQWEDNPHCSEKSVSVPARSSSFSFPHLTQAPRRPTHTQCHFLWDLRRLTDILRLTLHLFSLLSAGKGWRAEEGWVYKLLYCATHHQISENIWDYHMLCLANILQRVSDKCLLGLTRNNLAATRIYKWATQGQNITILLTQFHVTFQEISRTWKCWELKVWSNAYEEQ